jgi:hypothetical protein
MGFQNRTEFSDYVARIFENAANKSKATTLALSNMDEQFYGVRSDAINGILKFYFPSAKRNCCQVDSVQAVSVIYKDFCSIVTRVLFLRLKRPAREPNYSSPIWSSS